METRPELLSDAFQKLLEDYSPEQISKKFKIENADEPSKLISHETIYKYIYATAKGELKKLMIAHLSSKRKLRKDRSQAHHRRGGIPDAIPISERPKEVDARLVPGHWEGDLIIGKNHKSAL